MQDFFRHPSPHTQAVRLELILTLDEQSVLPLFFAMFQFPLYTDAYQIFILLGYSYLFRIIDLDPQKSIIYQDGPTIWNLMKQKAENGQHEFGSAAVHTRLACICTTFLLLAQ
jgi:hypothetical protein